MSLFVGESVEMMKWKWVRDSQARIVPALPLALEFIQCVTNDALNVIFHAG